MPMEVVERVQQASALRPPYDALHRELASFIPRDRIVTDQLRLLTWGTDASFYRLVPQIAVVVASEEEVARLLESCDRLRTPVTFRAAGTSLSGQAITDSVLVLLGDHWRRCDVGARGHSVTLQPGVIGAEANLAARLQSIAEPGGICLSYETYALVRDMVRATPLDPIVMKGIRREVVPYMVDGLLGELAQRQQVIIEHVTGMDLFLDLDAIKDSEIERAKKRLSEALAALDAGWQQTRRAS